MKKPFFKLSILFILIFALTALLGCGSKQVNSSNQSVTMEATILQVGDTILVEVTKSDYAFGEYILHVNNETKFYGENGNKISKSDLAVGNSIKVSYSGQVMLSIPPQVVAYKIELI